jgi:hypothetical protein
MLVILALGSLSQEDHKFKGRLGYRVSSKPGLYKKTLSQKTKSWGSTSVVGPWV